MTGGDLPDAVFTHLCARTVFSGCVRVLDVGERKGVMYLLWFMSISEVLYHQFHACQEPTPRLPAAGVVLFGTLHLLCPLGTGFETLLLGFCYVSDLSY